MHRHNVRKTSPSCLSETGQFNASYRYLLTRSRCGLANNTSIKIYNHTSPGPRKRREIPHCSCLVAGYDKGHILEGTTPVDHHPPVGWRGGPERIHIGRDPNQNLRAIQNELSDDFRKEPVVTNCSSDSSYLRFGHWENLILVIFDIMRARMHFPGDPRINLAVPQQDAARSI